MLEILLSLKGDISQGPRIADITTVHMIWATHDRILVSQVVEDFVNIMFKPVFGYLILLDVHNKKLKVSSIVGISAGSYNTKMKTVLVKVMRYEKAKLFMIYKMLEKNLLSRKQYYAQSVVKVVIDEVLTVRLYNSNKIIDIEGKKKRIIAVLDELYRNLKTSAVGITYVY